MKDKLRKEVLELSTLSGSTEIDDKLCDIGALIVEHALREDEHALKVFHDSREVMETGHKPDDYAEYCEPLLEQMLTSVDPVDKLCTQVFSALLSATVFNQITIDQLIKILLALTED